MYVMGLNMQASLGVTYYFKHDAMVTNVFALESFCHVYLGIVVTKLVIFWESVGGQSNFRKLIIFRSGSIPTTLHCIGIILFGEAPDG